MVKSQYADDASEFTIQWQYVWEDSMRWPYIHCLWHSIQPSNRNPITDDDALITKDIDVCLFSLSELDIDAYLLIHDCIIADTYCE
jgi:hypothetical protein